MEAKIKDKNKWKSTNSLCVLAIFVLIYGRGYGETVVDKFSQICAIVIIPLLYLSFLKLRKFCKDKLDKVAFEYAVLSVVLFAISAPMWYSFYNAYSYVGVVLAYIVYLLDCNQFRKLIVYALIACTFLELIEFISEHYFFITSLEDIELDEKLFSGGGAFRAKGIFKGPLSVGPFAVLTYLLNNKKRWILLLAMVACFLANSRTGIVILSMLFIIQLFGGRIQIKYIIAVIVIGGVIMTVMLSNAVFSSSIERILDVSNTESGTNQARMFFWLAGISTYLGYPLSHLVVGNNGFFRSIYENNPESGWICLLTDCGVVGFLFYLTPLIYCLLHFFRKGMKSDFFITIAFIIMNFVITANLSATSNLVYWIFVFELYNKAKYKVCKGDIVYIPNLQKRK